MIKVNGLFTFCSERHGNVRCLSDVGDLVLDTMVTSAGSEVLNKIAVNMP